MGVITTSGGGLTSTTTVTASTTTITTTATTTASPTSAFRSSNNSSNSAAIDGVRPASDNVTNSTFAATAAASAAPGGPSIFCFTSTVRRQQDEGVFPEVKRQLEKCDGHMIFTDRDAPGPELGFFKVDVPRQTADRGSGGWLFHRNFALLLPAWAYLIASGVAAKYDWVINTEFDHVVIPSRVRSTIQLYVGILGRGTAEEQASVNKSMMLMWGNAFAFNREMVREMARQWPALGRGVAHDSVSPGCPAFMEGKTHWPECSQDIVYPTLTNAAMSPFVKAVGQPGCHQYAQSALGVEFPLACLDLDHSPYGLSEDGQLAAIRDIAAVQRMGGAAEAGQFYEARRREAWYHFQWARQVPIIHHAQYASVHTLARELLLP